MTIQEQLKIMRPSVEKLEAAGIPPKEIAELAKDIAEDNWFKWWDRT